jgi:urea transport system permease protein
MRVIDLLCRALVLACLVLAASRAHAQSDPAPALQRLATDNFAEIEAGVAALAATAAPSALPVIEALRDGRLQYRAADKSLFIRALNGALTEAATGTAPASPPGPLRPVRLNNRVRAAVEAALGSMTLLAPDPSRRLGAAEAVFRSRRADALPLVEAALAQERDARVRRAMEEARAAILLLDPAAPEAERIAAVAPVERRGDQDALGLLRAASAGAADSPALRERATRGLKAIERRQALLAGVQNAWYGLSLGSVLLLAAIGLAITFGVMGVINMAHGEMVMLGAYTTFLVQEVIRTHQPALFDLSLPIAIPLAFLVAGGVGALMERGIVCFLYGRPLDSLLATWGVSLVLQQAVRTLFGPTNREVGAPSYMSGSFDLLGIGVTWGRLWIIVFGLSVFALLLLVLRATSFGLRMRAVTQNRRMAASMGIRTPRIDTLAFALGSGIAGVAGVALSQIDNVSPNLGQSYIIDSFLVVVFGGVGSLWGTLVAAFTLGVANKFLEPYAGAVLGKILLLVFIILFIQRRPRGLFALKGRAVEA